VQYTASANVQLSTDQNYCTRERDAISYRNIDRKDICARPESLSSLHYCV